MRGLAKKIFLLFLFLILASVQLSTKIIKERPSSPTDPNPPNNAVEVVQDPILTWSSTDAISYDVYFGSNFPLTKIATVKNPRVKLASLLPYSTRFYWRIVARNIHGSTSGPAWIFTTGNKTHTVSEPGRPIGPSSGKSHKFYVFSTEGLKCAQGHSVEYRYDWGDGTYSDWRSKGETSHSWSKIGTYTVKVQARCSKDPRVVSPWSSGVPVTIHSSTWTTKRLTQNPADLEYPKVAASGDYVHVIFREVYTLAYKRSTDGGSTWEPRQNLSTSGLILSNNYGYAIAAGGPYVHVVIARRTSPTSAYKIWYRRNTNYGQSGYWGIWRQITAGSNYFWQPDITVAGQYVHIVYSGVWPGRWTIFYKRISNYGVGSSLTRRLTYAEGSSMRPRIATSSVYVYVVFDNTWEKYKIMFKRISNYGAGDYITSRLTHDTQAMWLPDIAAFGPYVFVAYRKYVPPSDGDIDIFYKTIESYGTGSITTKRLTYAGRCYQPSIAFDSNTDNVQIAYYVYMPGTGNPEIFWKVIPNFGKGIFSTYRLTYSASGASLYPDISVVDSTTHIVYQDDWPGSKEIFYKRR